MTEGWTRRVVFLARGAVSDWWWRHDDVAGIADRFEEINDTWREEIPAQQSADLAELDGLLLEMDQLDATDEVDLLRGQIELLMDQIELVIGPVTVTDDDGAVDDI